MIKKHWMLVLVLLLAAVLAACQPAATATPTPSPVPPTEVPTEVPTEEPTVAPPTEEPTEEPVADETPEAMTVEEATEEPVAEETAEPEVQTVLEATEEPEAEATVEPEGVEAGTIVEVASGDEEFSTLVAAVVAADLAEALSAEGPFTVFAPTNAAFEAALEALGLTAEELLADTETLTSVLLYHVVAGEARAADLEDGQELETLQGGVIVVSVSDDEVTLNETVRVVAADVEASNGVIHVIDGVLLPPAPEEEEAAVEPTAVPVTGENVVIVQSGEPVVLGLATGLSGEGIAPLGIDIQRGVELALADRPSVTVGGVEFNVVLDVQDDQCSADGGQAVANRFAADGNIVGVVGPMCSSACFAAAPIFDAAGYTTISASCTNPLLTFRGFTSFNRAVVSDGLQGRVAASFIYNELGARRIATIHDGSPYGEGLVLVMSQEFERLGGEVVRADAIRVGDTDFRGLLEDIAAREPDLIYFGGFSAEAARLVIQRGDVALEDVPFVGADGVRTAEFISLAGSAAEGAYATSAIPASSEALDAFIARYVEVYGEEPPAPFHANGYDAANIFLDAIEAVGTLDEDGNLIIDRAALSAYVRSLENFQGLTGVLTNDGTGETSTAGIFGIAQVQDGAFVQIAVGTFVDDEVVIEMEPEAEATVEPEGVEAGTIVEVASGDEEFSTLVAA
ncbi:MAG: ABC transporter substrate-binding protein, partial [Aggregatilineales bacterium]